METMNQARRNADEVRRGFW